MPLLWLSLAFVAGILLASRFPHTVLTWLILAGISLVGAVLIHRLFRLSRNSWSSRMAFAALAISVGFLGSARFQATIPENDPYFIAWYNDRDYVLLVTGTLVEPPDYRDSYTNLKLRVQGVDTGDNRDLPVQGLILARVPPNTLYHYGDRVRLRGKLQTPPVNEDFSYRDYLARQGIHAYMPNAKATILPWHGGNPVAAGIYKVKERSLANIYKLYPDPEASLLAGILLGVETGLPADLQRIFKNTGTAHIIAISGFNIAIIAALFVSIFSKLFGPRIGALTAVIGIALYTLLVGGDAAVVRAAIMGGLSLFARQVGRRQHGLNTLAFTAALMSIFNPHTPWDIGFQLSFGATLGLILYAQPFTDAFARFVSRFLPQETAQRLAAPVSEFVLLTFAAQLTTLPIMAYHFKQISLVSLVANPFILPVQPAVMIIGGLAVILSLVYLPLGQLVAFAAWPFPAYTIRIVEMFDQLPHGVITLGEFSLLFVLAFYGILFALTFARERLQSLRPILSPASAVTCMAVTAMIVWRSVAAAPDGNLHLTFLDVGSADAVLIQSPTGRTLLVNGGPSPSRLSDALGRRLPPFQRELDYLIAASTQEHQVAALPRTLERFPPADVLWAGKVESSYSARRLEAWLVDQAVPITRVKAGHTLDLGGGATLNVLSSDSRGSVLLIEWNNFRTLLPVGISFNSLDDLMNNQKIESVSVMTLAESGYAPTNPPEWIRQLNPDLVILNVAAGDKDGLPHSRTLESVRDYNLLRTDQNGWIHLSTDGENMWVEVERK